MFIEIPHLKDGQKIKDYSVLYKGATVGLKPEEKLAALPIYIHRTEGEQKLAIKASQKTTLAEAFQFLREVLDGDICAFTQAAEFFNKTPKGSSPEAIRAYFFELFDLSTSVEVPTDMFLKKFFTNIPNGKKLFNKQQNSIKKDMDEAAIYEFYKVLAPNLQREFTRTTTEGIQIKEEPFVFTNSHQEEPMPAWAQHLTEKVSNLELAIHGNEGDNSDSNAFPAKFDHPQSRESKKLPNKPRPKCENCGRLGHYKSTCFFRICENCGGKGHDNANCTSSTFRKSTPQESSRNKSR